MKVGILENGMPVYVSKNSPNRHVAVLGISGSGKSTRIRTIMNDITKTGGTVLAIDLAGKDYGAYGFNVISAKDDGINLQILEEGGKSIDKEGEAFIVSIFTQIFGLGPQQQAALRIAIEFAKRKRGDFDTEMEAIGAGLKRQSTGSAKSAYGRMWGILESGYLHSSKRAFVTGKINSLSFNDINPQTQKALAEIVLAMIWQKVRMGQFIEGPLCIVVDEFQNFSLGKNAILLEMLRESRKYGICMILATQSTENLSRNVLAAINQTSVQLYFRPSLAEVKKIANLIDSQNVGKISLLLKHLQVGQSLAIGNLSIKGREIDSAILIRSDLRTNDTFLQIRTKAN